MVASDFNVSLDEHAHHIIEFIELIHAYGLSKAKYSVLENQLRLKSSPREKTEYIDESKLLSRYQLTQHDDLHIISIQSIALSPEPLKTIDMRRTTFELKPL